MYVYGRKPESDFPQRSNKLSLALSSAHFIPTFHCFYMVLVLLHLEA